MVTKDEKHAEDTANAAEGDGPPPEPARITLAAFLFAHWTGPDRSSEWAQDAANKAFDRADDFIAVAKIREPAIAGLLAEV